MKKSLKYKLSSKRNNRIPPKVKGLNDITKIMITILMIIVFIYLLKNNVDISFDKESFINQNILDILKNNINKTNQKIKK